jgi:hypothetical protein
VIAVISATIAIGQGRRLHRLRRAQGARPRVDLAARETSAEVGAELAELREAIVTSIRHVGMVRFDAFEDMGGKLSFAVALLDEEGSGVVFSSINGRNETRVYAKPVERGVSRIDVSEEEEEAIRRALAGVRV